MQPIFKRCCQTAGKCVSSAAFDIRNLKFIASYRDYLYLCYLGVLCYQILFRNHFHFLVGVIFELKFRWPNNTTHTEPIWKLNHNINYLNLNYFYYESKSQIWSWLLLLWALYNIQIFASTLGFIQRCYQYQNAYYYWFIKSELFTKEWIEQVI